MDTQTHRQTHRTTTVTLAAHACRGLIKVWSVVTFMINHHGQLLRFALNSLQSSLVPRLLRYEATCNLQKNVMHTDIILLRTNGLITNCDIFFNHTALDLSYMVVLLLVGVARALVMVDSRL